MNRIKTLSIRALVPAGLALPLFANATADTSAITSTQTDALAYVAALLAMVIAVWGAGYVKKFFKS